MTGRRVALDLLEQSLKTGRFCLRRLFVTCVETGQRLPHGQRVLIALESQYFFEELGTHQATEHFALDAVFDAMTLQ